MGWADGDMALVKQCAETVLRAAKQILTDLTPATTQPDRDDAAPDDALGEDRPGLLLAADASSATWR